MTKHTPQRDDWQDDCAPGIGIARAIVYSIAGLIVLAVVAWAIVQ